MLFVLLPSLALAALPTITVGQPAPDFTLTDTDGATRSLAEQRGQVVVLEWFNPDCPFVKKAYTGGPQPDLAARWTDAEVVWWAINSGAEGKQGHGIERNQQARTDYAMSYPILLDESGDVGRMYGARTTPQMFVIAPDGTVAYAGALDNAPLSRVPRSGHQAWTDQALQAVTAGQSVGTSQTKSWGCSVKYK